MGRGHSVWWASGALPAACISHVGARGAGVSKGDRTGERDITAHTVPAHTVRTAPPAHPSRLEGHEGLRSPRGQRFEH